MASLQSQCGRECGHKYVRALFSYDNMPVTLPLRLLRVFTQLSVIMAGGKTARLRALLNAL